MPTLAVGMSFLARATRMTRSRMHAFEGLVTDSLKVMSLAVAYFGSLLHSSRRSRTAPTNENFIAAWHEFFAINAKGVCNRRRPAAGYQGHSQLLRGCTAKLRQNSRAVWPQEHSYQ